VAAVKDGRPQTGAEARANSRSNPAAGRYVVLNPLAPKNFGRRVSRTDLRQPTINNLFIYFSNPITLLGEDNCRCTTILRQLWRLSRNHNHTNAGLCVPDLAHQPTPIAARKLDIALPVVSE
jgi:hypothetical protein